MCRGKLALRLAKQVPPAPLDFTPAIRSKESSIKVPIEFHNQLETPVQIAWITERGIRRPVGRVQPGGVNRMTSRVGHVFVVEALDGTLHRVVTADYPDRKVILRPTEP